METLNQTNPSPISQSQAAEPTLQSGLLQSDTLQSGSLPPLLFRLGVDTALPYRTGCGRISYRAGICRLRLFVPARVPVSARCPAIALVTEIPDQNGLSITNGIEVIAAQLCRIHGLKPHNTVLIEHYDDRERGFCARLPGRVNGEKFSCVIFEELRETDGEARAFRLRHPRWRPLGKEEVEALIGVPLPYLF